MRIATWLLVLCAGGVGCNRSSNSSPIADVPAQSPVTTETASPNAGAEEDTPDPKWREMFFEDTKVLSNVPEISVMSNDGKSIRVVAKNVGTTTLQYYSAGAENIQLFQEIKMAGRWTQSNWDWCGTGKQQFEIAPNASAELVVDFCNDEEQERMLANFSEKDTNRSGLVVLATEPDK